MVMMPQQLAGFQEIQIRLKILDLLDLIKSIDEDLVPGTSLLREFIGNSIFTDNNGREDR
jgi:hypothetical protein